MNNVQIGIEYAFEQYGVTHCAILDIDLHHGDGSQDICWERAGFTGDYGQQEEDEIVDPKLNPRDDYGKRFATYPKVGYFQFMISNHIQLKWICNKENIKMHLLAWIMISTFGMFICKNGLMKRNFINIIKPNTLPY